MVNGTINNYGYSGIKRELISEAELQEKIREAGKKISREYAGKPLLLVSILKGSFMFLADLCRAIEIPCEVAFMSASSYGDGTVSSGNVKIKLDIDRDISKYHVIIAEDIIDSGRTLTSICELLRERNPLSLSIYTLLDKPSRHVTNLKADHILFTVPDLFVVGYGLDHAEKFRNLPYIAEAEL